MEFNSEDFLDMKLKIIELEKKVKENEACNSYLQGFIKGLSEKVYMLENEVSYYQKD